MQLNQKILNPHGNLLWGSCKVVWAPPPPVPRSSVSLRAHRSSNTWKWRRDDTRLRIWKLLGGVVMRRYEGGRKEMEKENEPKERDLCSVACLQPVFFFFFVLMSSRWAPTLATQWQPRTSIMTGEWLLLQRRGQMIVKMLGTGRWRRPSDWNGK